MMNKAARGVKDRVGNAFAMLLVLQLAGDKLRYPVTNRRTVRLLASVIIKKTLKT